MSEDQCSTDLSAVRTLKKPGMGGISIIVHGNTTCLDVIPLPIPSAQINTDFFSFQGTFFTAPLTYEMCLWFALVAFYDFCTNRRFLETM